MDKTQFLLLSAIMTWLHSNQSTRASQLMIRLEQVHPLTGPSSAGATPTPCLSPHSVSLSRVESWKPGFCYLYICGWLDSSWVFLHKPPEQRKLQDTAGWLRPQACFIFWCIVSNEILKHLIFNLIRIRVPDWMTWSNTNVCVDP